MKGFITITLIRVLIVFLIVFGIAMAIWLQTEDRVAHTGPESIGAIMGAVMLRKWNNGEKSHVNNKKRKKGIVMTTSMLATIIFFIVVVFVIFLILASLGAEAGPSSSSFFYSVFDSMIRSLPWVS